MSRSRRGCWSRTISVGSLLVLTVAALTDPMPYRVGYGLGSWIEPEVVESMKTEAKSRSQIVLASKMSTDAESVARELQLEANPVTNPQDSAQTIPRAMSPEEFQESQNEVTAFRREVWTLKLNAYEQLFKLQEEQMDQLLAAGEGDGDAKGAPTTFASSVESPVNWELSPLVYMDRGFDSIEVDATFYRTEYKGQKMSSSDVASSMAASLGGGAKGVTVEAGVAASVRAKAMNTLDTQNVEYTMLLSAFASHRKTKQFKSVVIAPEKLLSGWNFYHKSDAIPNPKTSLAAFFRAYMKSVGGKNGSGDADKYISIIAETFLCSSLVGMVHFIKVESTSSSQSSVETTASVTAKLTAAMQASNLIASTSIANTAAAKLASMSSSSKMEISFDLISKGFIPSIKSQAVKNSIQQFKDFDPSTFGIPGVETNPSTAGALGQNAQQSNMGSVIKSTVMGLQETVTEQQVLDVQTFMDAFDDWAEGIRTVEGAGIPCGLNVKRWSKQDIMNALAEKYFPGGAQQGEAGLSTARDESEQG